ncbi:MAG TPA: cytidylate kinase family protein, partial [Propionicimonas sp.]|nr:cytidylate kinase family protein [Propionicimonas sp.]
RQYGLHQLNDIYDHKPKVWELFNDNSVLTIQMMNQTIAAFAARGNVVILGRGGFKVLEGMGDVLNVFVKAPQDIRVARIAKRENLSEDAATDRIKADDELRARFTRLFYSANWADESLFDLVVDTGVDSDEAALARIVAAVNALQVPGEVDRAAANIDVDPVLNRTIDGVLGRRTAKLG